MFLHVDEIEEQEFFFGKYKFLRHFESGACLFVFFSKFLGLFGSRNKNVHKLTNFILENFSSQQFFEFDDVFEVSRLYLLDYYQQQRKSLRKTQEKLLLFGRDHYQIFFGTIVFGRFC
jgi:hypothetical protein